MGDEEEEEEGDIRYCVGVILDGGGGFDSEYLIRRWEEESMSGVRCSILDQRRVH